MSNFFGMAAVVHGLDIPGTEVTSIYDGFHGTIYSGFVEQSAVDTTVMRQWSEGPPARILDLCCGLGRFARGLAADGHSVTAVDLSRDTIGRARELWRNRTGQAAGDVEFSVGDATSLGLEEKFDTVVIGGLSLSTFDGDGRNAVLREIRRNLRPGGTLLCDYMPRPAWEGAVEKHFPFPYPSDEGKAFTVLSVRQAPSLGTQVTNMYSEIIGPDGATRRVLSSETVTYLDPPVVLDELREAGFRVEEETEIKPSAAAGERAPRFVMMRCTAV